MMAGKDELSTHVVRPFLPSRDYALSKRFYLALGFQIIFEADQVTGFASDTGAFLLQNYYQKDWAENFMMQMVVHNLEAWWAHLQTLDLPGNFGVAAPKPPALQSWGLVVAYVFGPSGELWHVVQNP